MFSNLNLLSPDPILGMQTIFKSDARPNKINLSIGVCVDPEGKLLRFKAINSAIQQHYLEKPSKEYLPITGMAEFCHLAQKLVCDEIRSDELFSMQTLGGTGALYLAAKLLHHVKTPNIYIPNSSWTNHKPLFESAGHSVQPYPYHNEKTGTFDFEGLCQFIGKMPAKSGIVLQASCHNPTGIDPTVDQWQHLSRLIKKQMLVPIFDLAYLGFGEGLAEDAFSIRTFLKDGHELFIATSFSKSFGLYNDRIGLLTVASHKAHLPAIGSHLRDIARKCYSSPPAVGAWLIKTVLQNEPLANLWKEELLSIRTTLIEQRVLLYQQLQNQKVSFSYEHLLTTKGLFCLFDLGQENVLKLRENKALYVGLDGRLALAAIPKNHLAKLAEALASVS